MLKILKSKISKEYNKTKLKSQVLKNFKIDLKSFKIDLLINFIQKFTEKSIFNKL